MAPLTRESAANRSHTRLAGGGFGSGVAIGEICVGPDGQVAQTDMLIGRLNAGLTIARDLEFCEIEYATERSFRRSSVGGGRGV